jgi:hypothetical protein
MRVRIRINIYDINSKGTNGSNRWGIKGESTGKQGKRMY